MAIVTESFLPEVNGVTNSVLRVVEQLELLGHTALVIAPGPGPSLFQATPVERVAAATLPMYRSLPVAVPGPRVRSILRDFSPDVVHLAAPVVLGAMGGVAARHLGLPAVAVYQTDLAGFARRYRLHGAAGLIWRWLRFVHHQASLTLAPSTLSAWELRRHGIGPVSVWARGVDQNRFNRKHRDHLLRRRLAPEDEVLVGYVGRLAKEKQVHLLAHLSRLPSCRVVIVGDGPERPSLERQLPNATFLGFLRGEELSRAVASLDVFVHTGANETFCQSIQEALSAGVAVVAPAAGGPLDLVKHGDNGWLYPPDKPDLLAPAVETLVADEGLRKAMAARAVASVRDRTWPQLVDELIGHYRHISSIAEPWRRAA